MYQYRRWVLGGLGFGQEAGRDVCLSAQQSVGVWSLWAITWCLVAVTRCASLRGSFFAAGACTLSRKRVQHYCFHDTYIGALLSGVFAALPRVLQGAC